MDPSDPARALRAENAALRSEIAALRERIGPFPPGHFHSPIPDAAEVRRDAARLFGGTGKELPGLDRNEAGQLRRLEQLAAFAGQERFPEVPEPGTRYHSGNEVFGYADAFAYHGMLRLLAPRRVIEIGSGYSSAVLLDTLERHPWGRPRITFVEPDPARLRSLLRPADWGAVELIEGPVQELALERFLELGPGDVLFVDSSHVSKTASDVNFLVLEVFPRLAPGVSVHVHDVPVDFEYPREWVEAGWAWNEAYLLRAFLAFNAAFAIDFHGPWLAERHTALCLARLPRCSAGPGTSLWIRRTDGADGAGTEPG